MIEWQSDSVVNMQRRLSDTGISIAPVGLGCWPLAGMTSGDIGDDAAVEIVHAALDAGVNHLDTAHAYGRGGESELRLRKALGKRRNEAVLATKVGLYWNAEGELTRDSSPGALRRMCQTSLARLGTDHVELLYLHVPDGKTPIAESAGELKRLRDEGKARCIGVSNCTVEEMERFATECPIAACQPRYNMLQRDIEADVLPWCREHDVSILAYEPLAMGLLTGKFTRGHVFAETDWRRNSPLFQGNAWTENLQLVDRLRPVAEDLGCTLPALVVAWTIHRPGITAALCGAKRPEQIRDTAAAMEISAELLRTMQRRLFEAGIDSHIQ